MASEKLWSWWTNLPFVNLTAVESMVAFMGGGLRKLQSVNGSWREISRNISFPRFEHVGYQQWRVLHDGFQFEDVSEIVGEVNCSFLECPPIQGLSKMATLRPLWVSCRVFDLELQKRLSPSINVAEPLLFFMADVGKCGTSIENHDRRMRWCS